MRTRRRHNGGAMWRQGEDACIFKPVVKCAGDSKSYGDGYISRITNKKDDGFKIEDVINNKFKALSKSGWVATYVKSCKPEYTEDDMRKDGEFDTRYPQTHKGECNKLINKSSEERKDDVNLIYKQLGSTLTEINTKAISLETAFTELQHAFSTVIELIPDSGPWLIHTDLHTDNILYNTESHKYILNDWGRTLIIDDPTSLTKSAKNVVDFLDKFYPFLKTKAFPEVFQIPKPFAVLLRSVYRKGTITEQELRGLRIWPIIVLFKTAFYMARKRDRSSTFITKLIEDGMNREDIRKQVDIIVSSLAGEDEYIQNVLLSRGETVNKTRKRELKPCKEGQARNPVTNRCRKITARKEKTPRVEAKPCPDGKIRNPATNRCVKADGKIGKAIPK